MKPRIYIFLPALIIFIMISIIGCNTRKQFAEELLKSTNIISLEQNIESLYKVARNWEPDAYLVGIHITFYGKTDGVIGSVFESKNHDLVSFSVRKYMDGHIEESHYFKYDISPDNEIEIADLKVDSRDAIKIAFSELQTKEFLNGHADKICGFMNLEKTNIQDHLIIWRINFDNCTEILQSMQIEVDAKTGEIVNTSK